MKKNQSIFSGIFSVLIVAAILVSCEKEEEKKPYYGHWESRAYPTMSLQGQPIYEKMVFDFTNTTFEDKIYQGADSLSLVLVSGIKGTIENPSEGTLKVEIMEISLQGGPYTNKEADPTVFNTMFSSTIGLLLHEEFTATYSITGSEMSFVIPVINPFGGDDIVTTLRLLKE